MGTCEIWFARHSIALHFLPVHTQYFILAQAQKNAQDDLLEALDTNETEV